MSWVVSFLNWIKSLFSHKSVDKEEQPEVVEPVITDTVSHNIQMASYEIEQDFLMISAEEFESVTDEPVEYVEVVEAKEDILSAAGVKQPKYFTVAELSDSATAKERKIDNTPSEEIKSHLVELIVDLLDPLRESWAEYCTSKGYTKKGIKINSGYRCPKLNVAVGGSKTSAHLVGYAADTKPANGLQSEYERFVRKWVDENPDIKFD